MKGIAGIAALVAALVVSSAAWTSTHAAGGPKIFGANEDAPKFTDDQGAAMYGQMAAIGMTQNVLSVTWDPAVAGIPNQSKLAAAIASAGAKGVSVVLAVYPAKSRAVADSGPAGFIGFCGAVADAFPSVRAFIVGNEPNQPRFWQPQFNSDGTNASAASFLTVLAGCYDSLKARGRTVVGVGLSPRGNDNPNAASNISSSPVRFLAALGRAYRASGRTAPLMDAFSFHPYPNVNTDAPSVGYRWPNAGVPNYDRIKQALWDAFNGTGQPTVESGLPLWIDEVGWQADTASRGGYANAENIPTIDEATQALYHAEVLRRAACDPAVAALHFFHWIDESDRGGFQSGGFRVDGSARPAYAELSKAIQETRGGTACPAPLTSASWSHATGVVNASANFGNVADKPANQRSFAISASADENANATYALVAVDDGSPLTAAEKAGVRTAVAGERAIAAVGAAPKVVVAKNALVKAYFNPRLELADPDFARGYHVFAVLLGAESNPARQSMFVSAPFLAGSGATPAGGTAALTVTTSLASRVLLESALLQGGVKAPAGKRLEAWFEYGPAASVARKTKPQRFAGSDPTISAQLANLAPRASWSYRVAVQEAGKPATRTLGPTRSFTLVRPALMTVPLVLVDDVDDQRAGVEVDTIVSATGDVRVALKLRRLPGAGRPGDAGFRLVDSETVSTGVNGQDLFLTLKAANLQKGRYRGQVVATSRGRDVVRAVRFTID